MPRLIPQSLYNGIANMVIPSDVRKQVTDFFRVYTEPVDAETFSEFIKMDVSLWKQLMPTDLKSGMQEHVHDYMTWIHLIDERFVLSWVCEARPDISSTLNTEQGRLWFFKQWREITQALGV